MSAVPARLRFLDTNILLYSITEHLDEQQKRQRAISLLAEDNLALSVQVLQEFYVQATKPTKPAPLTHAMAADFIQTWSRFEIQDNTFAVLTLALNIKASYGFSYWDSNIIAAAQILGCKTLYTEDLSHGRVVAGVEIVNPFL